jgi:predicted lipid-binding transport protein (Tim44 family)
MGFGGGGMGGGYGGPGIFDILLLAGIGYLIYRYVKKRRESQEAYPQQYGATDYQPTQVGYSTTASPAAGVLVDDLGTGLANVRQMDYSFDEGRFKDTVMDLFFKVQGAWMNRDLTPVISILTEEMRGVLQEDVQRLIRERRINRLENIAVRTVEITEAWQESGQDFITAQIYANLLDYTTDDAGQVVEGRRTEPVKFEEYWTSGSCRPSSRPDQATPYLSPHCVGSSSASSTYLHVRLRGLLRAAL